MYNTLMIITKLLIKATGTAGGGSDLKNLGFCLVPPKSCVSNFRGSKLKDNSLRNSITAEGCMASFNVSGSIFLCQGWEYWLNLEGVLR